MASPKPPPKEARHEPLRQNPRRPPSQKRSTGRARKPPPARHRRPPRPRRIPRDRPASVGAPLSLLIGGFGGKFNVRSGPYSQSPSASAESFRGTRARPALVMLLSDILRLADCTACRFDSRRCTAQMSFHSGCLQVLQIEVPAKRDCDNAVRNVFRALSIPAHSTNRPPALTRKGHPCVSAAA